MSKNTLTIELHFNNRVPTTANRLTIAEHLMRWKEDGFIDDFDIGKNPVNKLDNLKIIGHGSRVRHKNWPNPFFAIVGTSRSYLKDAGYSEQNIKERLDKAKEMGEERVWTNYTGTALVGPGNDQYHANKKYEYDTSVILENGDVVLIEGVFWEVQFVKGNEGLYPKNCDPIKFVNPKIGKYHATLNDGNIQFHGVDRNIWNAIKLAHDTWQDHYYLEQDGPSNESLEEVMARYRLDKGEFVENSALEIMLSNNPVELFYNDGKCDTGEAFGTIEMTLVEEE